MTRNKKLPTKRAIEISSKARRNFEINGWSLAAYCRHAGIDGSWASRVLRGFDKTPSGLALKAQIIKASKEPKPEQSLPA